MTIKNLTNNKVFDGWHKQYLHQSKVLNCTMRFAIYLPPQATPKNKVPVMYWLSGLTCTDENFMQKSGALRIAAKLGIAIVTPDTSPRGERVPDDPDKDYALGLGAGFYVNATQAPWNTHYQMYDYVVEELPRLIEKHFPVSSQRMISGHSMGGHGALVIALRNPELFSSVSAFSPICHPMDCPWGEKAFSNYLGNDQNTWQQYDTSALLASDTVKSASFQVPALVMQGTMDEFLDKQLKPDVLESAAQAINYPLTIKMLQGYDHSYYFIASFIEEHLIFHAKNLQKVKKL
jgi:S-formylglutathione hydrolase